jgi:hypothetical protein
VFLAVCLYVYPTTRQCLAIGLDWQGRQRKHDIGQLRESAAGEFRTVADRERGRGSWELGNIHLIHFVLHFCSIVTVHPQPGRNAYNGINTATYATTDPTTTGPAHPGADRDITHPPSTPLGRTQITDTQPPGPPAHPITATNSLSCARGMCGVLYSRVFGGGVCCSGAGRGVYGQGVEGEGSVEGFQGAVHVRSSSSAVGGSSS